MCESCAFLPREPPPHTRRERTRDVRSRKRQVGRLRNVGRLWLGRRWKPPSTVSDHSHCAPFVSASTSYRAWHHQSLGEYLKNAQENYFCEFSTEEPEQEPPSEHQETTTDVPPQLEHDSDCIMKEGEVIFPEVERHRSLSMEKVDLCPEGGVALLRALFDHMAAQCSEGAASTASLPVPRKSGGQGTVNPPVRTGLVSQTCLQYDGCPENARPVHVRKAPRTYHIGQFALAQRIAVFERPVG